MLAPLAAFLLPLLAASGAPGAAPVWKTLQAGIDYAAIGDAAKARARSTVACTSCASIRASGAGNNGCWGRS